MATEEDSDTPELYETHGLPPELADEDLALTIAALGLGDLGNATMMEVHEYTGLSTSGTFENLEYLVEMDRAIKREPIGVEDGRTAAIYTPLFSGPDIVEETGSLDERIIQIFAYDHYVKGLSSVKGKRIERQVDANIQKVSARLRSLADDGVVERVGGGSSTKFRWRLTDVSDHAPFHG
jgi:hypothetical protein